MTAAALSNELKAILTRAGVGNPAGDAGLILEKALGCTRAALIARCRDEIADDIAASAVAMARRRASGEPIQYVLGEWSFMGRDYLVGEGVLIPRDDTEVVVRAALELMNGVPSPSVADLCAGSGIIAITLACELREPCVTAVEKSAEAFAYLEKNTARSHAALRLIHADLCDCADSFADRSLDLIISNPPYIPRAELPALQREVQYEPAMALDGGEDGTDFYELILRLWTPKLKEGGAIAFELGEEQYAPVAAMLNRHGYTDIKGYEDIQGTVRAVTAHK